MPRSRKAAQNIVPAVARALKVLEQFRREQPELSLSELCQRLRTPKSSTYRLAYTLESMGYLTRTPGGGFRLGPSILSLGFDYLASQELVDLAQPELGKLRDATDHTALLEVLEGPDVICIAQAVSHKTLATRVPVGARYPAYANAAGRALLALRPESEVEALYRKSGFQRFTPDTPHSLAALKRLLAADRGQGFVVSHGAYQRGIVAVAAVVRGARRDALAAVSVVGPATDLEDRVDGDVKDLVLQSSARLSSMLGFRD
jgi:DNA-binding IclR family transcriptional regulator